MKKMWIKDETGKRLYTKIVDGEAVLKPAKPKCANCGSTEHSYEQCDQDNWTYNLEEQEDE